MLSYTAQSSAPAIDSHSPVVHLVCVYKTYTYTRNQLFETVSVWDGLKHPSALRETHRGRPPTPPTNDPAPGSWAQCHQREFCEGAEPPAGGEGERTVSSADGKIKDTRGHWSQVLVDWFIFYPLQDACIHLYCRVSPSKPVTGRVKGQYVFFEMSACNLTIIHPLSH